MLVNIGLYREEDDTKTPINTGGKRPCQVAADLRKPMGCSRQEVLRGALPLPASQ